MQNSSPGEALRKLRKERNLKSEDLALLAGISRTTLSHFENDYPLQFERATIESLLTYLDSVKPVPRQERLLVQSPFGLQETIQLPTSAEIRRARQHWHSAFASLPLPVMLVDFAQRIYDTNTLMRSLLGTDLLKHPLEPMTIFDLAFNPVRLKAYHITNADVFLPIMVRVMKMEFAPFIELPWCRECVDDAMRRYPRFKKIWDSITEVEMGEIGVRAMGPIALRDGEGGIWTFSLIGTDLVSDPRFRAVQYMPQDEETLARCYARSAALRQSGNNHT